ncbi:hypothetical protein [Bradyrhizobium iriomotense]|uniref:hypothetical protein n=1 Tax=Bradyrhizobium iriomotense TaxID=441950 RepID=UPI001B8A373A|nr:hypothetical protein [Bradyrhizobium iriomotense]MBR1131916.1 hypothetical protein [Bradyrhizobium iriomotense]
MDATPLYPEGFSTRRPKRDLPPHRNRRGVTMPKNHIGPFARLVFAELGRQRMRYLDASELSGVQIPTIKGWRRKNNPGLESLTALLTTLRFQLCPVPELEALPPALAGELTALALKMRMNIPQTWCALLDIHTEQKLLRMRADERAAILAEHDRRMAGVANDNVKRAVPAA